MLKAVIFDMDGVIIDSEQLHMKVNSKVMANCGLDVEPEYFSKYIGVASPKMWKEIVADFKLDKTVDELLKAQFALNHSELEEGEHDTIEGIRELLIDLKKQGIRTGIGSSSPKKYIEAVVNKFGIAHYFDVIVSGEEVENIKPAPDVYLKVAASLGVKPSECLVLEDSNIGARAAKNAEMFCIGYVNENSGNQDLTIADVLVYNIGELSVEELSKMLVR